MDLSISSPQPPYILNGEFFEILSQAGESVTVRCCYCAGDRNIYKGSIRSTGNFHMHIKRRHPALIEKVHQSKMKAYLERRAMQQERRSAGKRRFIKTEKGAIDSKVLPIQAGLHAMNLQLNSYPRIPAKRNGVHIKYEPPNIEDAHRNVRNIFSVAANNLTVPRADQQFAQPVLTHNFAVSQQAEPTNLSLNQPRNPCEYMLPRLESTLRSIDKELRIRNQIETNRLFLELAKFKYINPDFHFRF